MPDHSAPKPIISDSLLQGIDKPELFFGVVSPVGAPLPQVINALRKELTDLGYECVELKLSDYLSRFLLPSLTPTTNVDLPNTEFNRIHSLKT